MTDTQQTDSDRDEKGRFAEGNKPKAGFDKFPQNRNPGGWKKDQSISYQYNYLLRLSVDNFRNWEITNPESKRTMAQEVAYRAVLRARKSLKDLQEVADRTEGKPHQTTDITTNGDSLNKISPQELFDTLTMIEEITKRKHDKLNEESETYKKTIGDNNQ